MRRFEYNVETPNVIIDNDTKTSINIINCCALLNKLDNEIEDLKNQICDQDIFIDKLKKELADELDDHEKFTKKSAEEIQKLKDRIENILTGEDGIIYNCLVLITDGSFEGIDREELADKLSVRKEYIDYLMDYYQNGKYKNFDEYFDKVLKTTKRVER